MKEYAGKILSSYRICRCRSTAESGWRAKPDRTRVQGVGHFSEIKEYAQSREVIDDIAIYRYRIPLMPRAS
jgi:hypothetical protein